MTTRMFCDFETKSKIDLPKCGAYNYAQSMSTEVLCMAYAFDEGEVQLWTPNQPFPEEVRRFNGLIYAHNAAFERLIFWYVLQIPFKLEQFYCTATESRANCGPSSLEDVGRFKSTDMRKDYRGAQLVRELCIPDEYGNFKSTPALLQELYDYCVQDVRTMRAVSQTMRPLSEQELRDYHVSERINDRGLLVDTELARAAVKYSADELAEVQQHLHNITNGEITSARSTKTRDWVFERLGPAAQKLMFSNGKLSFDKVVRANLIAEAPGMPEEIPQLVFDVICCVDDLQASSVAKFAKMATLADEEDSRVRGAFVFAGGAATGRSSSLGLQLHNFPRLCSKNPNELGNAIIAGERIAPKFAPNTATALKSMLRPALIAPKGKVLIVADWSSIEARVNPWCYPSPDSDAKLDLIRNNPEIYAPIAATTFNIPLEEVTEDQRQIGKIQELSLGFCGGAGAFEAMSRIYGVSLPPHEVDKMVQGWRRANPWAVNYGKDMSNNVRRALRNKNSEFMVGRTTYMFDGQHMWYSLPSGRVLCYPFMRFEGDEITYARASLKPAAGAAEWPRAKWWHGVGLENCAQATANDILRASLRRLAHLDVIAHIHDEIILECDEGDAEQTTSELKTIMCTPPPWAGSLPLDAKLSIMRRYAK